MCHIFVVSQLSCLGRCQKSLRECLFGCINLLNFKCYTMKFHNCYHTNVQQSLWKKYTQTQNREEEIPTNQYMSCMLNMVRFQLKDHLWALILSRVLLFFMGKSTRCLTDKDHEKHPLRDLVQVFT